MTQVRYPVIWRGITAVLGGVLALCLLTALPASADNTVSQGFTTAQSNLTPGTIMGLEPGTKRIVVPAVSAKHYQLLGVVADQPLIALSDGTNQVQIVVSGTTYAIVSDINGAVHSGDKITASPINGVGMKATNAGQIVGTAQEDLTAAKTTEHTITDKAGTKKTVKLASIPLQVAVGDYAGEGGGQSQLSAILPPSLFTLAHNVAGKDVSAFRILIGLIALIIGFVVAANLLQAGIRSGLISLGRNPLAKKTIRRAILDVILTSVGVLALTLIAVYLVIKS